MVEAREGGALLIRKTPWYRNGLLPNRTKRAEDALFLIGKDQKMYRMILANAEANLYYAQGRYFWQLQYGK